MPYLDRYEAKPLDVALSWGHSEKKFGRVLQQGIKGDQRIIRGYPKPTWHYTHARWNVGEWLSPTLLDALTWTGLIKSTDAQRYASQGPWYLDVTDPYVKFTHHKEVLLDDVGFYRVQWFDSDSYADVGTLDIQAAQKFSATLVGRPYDKPQLIGILVHDALGVADQKYSHKLDFGSKYTVCSGGVIAGLEVVRREREDRGFPVWARLMNGLHAERGHPAALAAAPKGWFGIGKPDWERELFLVGATGKHHLMKQSTEAERELFK